MKKLEIRREGSTTSPKLFISVDSLIRKLEEDKKFFENNYAIYRMNVGYVDRLIEELKEQK